MPRVDAAARIVWQKVQAAGMRSKQCRCYPCCSSHPRTRLLGHCKLLHRFCIQALLCCAAADWNEVASSQHQAVGLTWIRKGVAPMVSVLVSNSTTDNATSPLETRLRHSEARTEVAEEQEELEKQLLVNALAKAKKAEATVQQEKRQVSSEGKAAKEALQRQHDTEEKLQQALASLQQSQQNQKTLEEKEEEDLARAKSLEEKVVKVRQELHLEKKNSSRAVTNASEEGQKADRLRHQVLKLAKELADAKKEAEEEEKKGEDAKKRFSQEEHKAKLDLINQTQETAAAQKGAQKAEGAQNRAEKQLHTLEVALQDARRQWHFAEKNATKVMEEKAKAEEELRHSRIEAKADAQHLLSAEANASKAHHLADLEKTELQEEEQHAKETIDRANSKARAAEKHLIIQRHKLQEKKQLVDAMMTNTTDLNKKLEEAKNATKQEATKNQVLTKELHSAHVAIGSVKEDEETAENRSAALEVQKNQALQREQAMKQKAATTTEWARAAVANATKAAHKEMQAEEHMKVAIQNISTLRQEVQNLTASKWEADKRAKDSKVAADNATKEEHEALTAKNRAEDQQKKLLKSLQHVEGKLLDARHAMAKANQSKNVAEQGMREEKLEIAHLNQSLEFMRQREEKEKRLLHLAQQRTHQAQQETEFAKQNVTTEEEAARHREGGLEKKLHNATVALQKAQTTKTAAETQMRILNLTVGKEQARFQAEVRSDTEAKENATKLAEAVARMTKQSGFATAERENLTSQLQAAQKRLREMKTSKGKLIEEDGKEMKQLKDKLALFRRKEAEDRQAAKQAAKRAGEALHEAREGGQNVTAEVASKAEVAKLTEKLLQLRREASEEKKAMEEMAREKDRTSAATVHEAEALRAAKMEDSKERAALANATFEMEAEKRQVASLQRSLRRAKEKEGKLLPLILCLLLGFALTVGLLRRHFLAQRARQFETILRLSVERLKALKMLEDATVPLLSNGGQAAKDQLDE